MSDAQNTSSTAASERPMRLRDALRQAILPGVRSLVRQRLEGLTPSAAQVLNAAAVLAQGMRRQHLESMVDLPEDEHQLSHEAQKGRIDRGRVAECEPARQPHRRVHQFELDGVLPVTHDIER